MSREACPVFYMKAGKTKCHVKLDQSWKDKMSREARPPEPGSGTTRLTWSSSNIIIRGAHNFFGLVLRGDPGAVTWSSSSSRVANRPTGGIKEGYIMDNLQQNDIYS